ncbi:MAG: hypothetical protein P8X63_05425 [Desulfuromonadaceae bacterium]
MELSLPLAAEPLIPHRAPMRLVDRLLSYDHGAGTVEARIPADGLLVAGDGRLHEVALLELLAQAYAVVRGYGDQLTGQPVRRGFLVGVKEVVMERPVWAGDTVQIGVRTLATVDDFVVAEGEVRQEGETVARGSLKLWLSEEVA